MSSPNTDDTVKFPIATAYIVVVTFVFHVLVQAGIISGQLLSLIPLRFQDMLLDYGSIIAFLFTLPNLATYALVHSGWGHLLGNLAFLIVLGPSLERALGARTYMAIYVFGSVVAGLFALAGDYVYSVGADGTTTAVIIVGASASISAVMGGVLLKTPMEIIGVLPFVNFVIRAWMAVVMFIAEQLVVINTAGMGNAPIGSATLHLSGIGAGMFFIMIMPTALSAYEKFKNSRS
ncbi:MAG: rhomboid family intramembrane serine protease [Candidatus Obscuribacter sp.]|nr:rhomboid family intramembrane serine protease [Candidatus Obscuribacter sp.]